jgi:chromosome condensin MukBEF MukE localization factor
MSVDIGEAVLHFSADTKQLDSYLEKVQRAIQAARAVLNEGQAKQVVELTEGTE